MNSKEEGELFQDMQPRRQIFKRNISLSFGSKFVIRLVSFLFLIFIDILIMVIILSVRI